MATTADHVRNALDGRWKEMRDKARADLASDEFLPHHTPDLPAAREKALKQMRILADCGFADNGFSIEHGGTGNVGAAVTGIEMLAMSDLSLMVKAGVQWGLFGGAIENLGTDRHRKYVRPLIDLELLGCFAMTETGHGSDVQELETTATYDAATEEFVLHSPTPSSRKDYIGGAAQHATMSAVFAQLEVNGQAHGVHCFLVPIRDENGTDLPGVTTSDCGYKGGLAGVDNGRLMFAHVRIPRENLLNRFGDVAPDGTYSSPVENPKRRFFTMLGTLVRGRVAVGGAAGAAARVALGIATRYALQRRQFDAPGQDGEVLIMDYLVHQRRLLPLIAHSYALCFAQNELAATLHDIQSAGANADPQGQRELESRAAGLKAANTWHATRAIQECREACGGAGYMAENRLTALKADTDVFTTFEGDNHVLVQLVAKELLTAYAEEVRGMNPVEWMRFAVTTVSDVVKKRTAAQQIIQTILDTRPDNEEDGSVFNRGTQLRMFEDREQYLLSTAARRLQGAQRREENPFDAFNFVQDHVLHAARAHIDRVVLEAFIAGIASCTDAAAKELLEDVCDLHALSIIDEDKAWFMEHRQLSVERAKAVLRGINERCRTLRPHALTLIEGFGVPDHLLGSAMLDGPGTDTVRLA